MTDQKREAFEFVCNATRLSHHLACRLKGLSLSTCNHDAQRPLDSIALFWGYPMTIRTYQGPKSTCRALHQWAFENDVELLLIQPAKPTQNGFIESFNGRFRDESLNENWFSDKVYARRTINHWRQKYNECRPHSALNYLTPSAFAARWRNEKM